MRTLLLALLLTACSMDRTAEVPEVQSHGVYTQQYMDNAPVKVDILFVIDSSPAMAAVEDRVRTAISDVANVAEGRLDGPRSDIHVGVITADPHDGGILRRTALFDGAYLIDRKTTAANRSNYPGAFAPALLVSPTSAWPALPRTSRWRRCARRSPATCTTKASCGPTRSSRS